MLLVILSFSLFFFIGSFQYSAEAAQFPRFTSGIVIFGVLLILASDYLPGKVSKFVTEPVDLVSDDELLDDVDVKVEEETEENVNDELQRPVNASLFTAVLALVYVLSGHLVGYLWVSPLFVIAYGLWFNLPRRVVILLAALVFVVGFGFYSILNLSIDTGILI